MENSCIAGALTGAVSGAIATGIGYGKGKTIDKFEPLELAYKIPIGAGIGAYAGYRGISFDVATDTAINTGVVYLADYILKLLWRRVVKKLLGVK